MSLNWKEINCILSELDLAGGQIQKAVQSTFDVLSLHIYARGKNTVLLIALTPGACRIHETFRPVPKNLKPLRFAEFLKSRIVNGRIEEAEQLGKERIVRIIVRQGDERFRLYIRLWSNAANVVVTDGRGTVLDAMRRSPKRGEISGGVYTPETDILPAAEIKEFEIRELSGAGSFNERIDRFYAEQGGALSLSALKEQAEKSCNGRIGRIAAALENLKERREEYSRGESLKQYGDIIMANLSQIKEGSSWLRAFNFYTDEEVDIKIDPAKSGPAQAEQYYIRYRKAKNGLAAIEAEIREAEEEIVRLEETLKKFLAETNPLRLYKLLKTRNAPESRRSGPKRPGLSFRRGDWLLLVGRDARENDELLRRHVKGNDLWLHARDFPGAYVFIKQRAGKTVPLDILLDAGQLALFYSKGRGAGEGDLFYTPVKYLRRAKDGPRGLVIPSQEKNLHVKVEEKRLRELEKCKVE